MINNIISEYRKLAQKECKTWHKDFGIETDHLISARRIELVIINKNKNKERTFLFNVISTFVGY